MPLFKRLLIRISASLLAVTFLASEVAFAAPSQAPPALSPQQLLLRNPGALEVPAQFISLKEAHSGTNGRLILHIQDAHANLSGQKNMAAALDQILSRYKVSLILSEGGIDDCSLTPVKKLIPPDELKRLAKSYLMQGRLTGEESLTLVSDHPMKIMGLEDIDLYLRSVRAYGDLVDRRDAVEEYLRETQQALEKLKRKLYPQLLVDYEREHGKVPNAPAFASNADNLLELVQQAKVELTAFPEMAGLMELRLKERLLDFNLVNLEQAALAEEIAKKGGSDALKGEKAQQPAAQYAVFQRLTGEARLRNISMSGYPHFERYGEYLSHFSRLDIDRLLEEMERAEDAAYKALLPDDDARLTRAIDRYVGLLRTAYAIQMSTREFKLFQVIEPDFATPAYLAFINRKLAEQGYFEDLLPYKDLLEKGKTALEAFYDSVSRRDEAFLVNAGRILDEENQKVAVLITGGYHTPNLKKLFAEKGYGMAVLTPVITSETNQAKYEKGLLELVRTENKKVEMVDGRKRSDKVRAAAAVVRMAVKPAGKDKDPIGVALGQAYRVF